MPIAIGYQHALLVFEQAFQQGVRRRFMRRITGQAIELATLEACDEAVGYAAVDRGLQVIALDDVRGSVGGNNNFDHEFLPTHKGVQDRWVRVYIALQQDQMLPPIEVVQTDAGYYVRNGHHRVSVALYMGQYYIDAYVIEQSNGVAACR